MLECRKMLYGLVSMLAIPSASEAASFRGKLWLVANSNGNLQGSFPVPSAIPDATFTTDEPSFYMSAPSPNCINLPCPTVNNTVSHFLNSVALVKNLLFSGLVNNVVGSVVGQATPVVNSTAASEGTYGLYIEFTGKVRFTYAQPIIISHDDGVSVKIDGSLVAGFTSGTGVTLDMQQFKGSNGVHKVDVVYVNATGPGFVNMLPIK